MKKSYSLDFSIDRDVERVTAVADILDRLEKNPSESELEQMASYILYGKDEEGYNAVQRGEITNGNTRYSSYRRKDDKLLSLDELLENPLTDQQDFKPSTSRTHYTNKKPQIKRPKIDRKTGAVTDPGDSIIPGMIDLWDSIDRLEHQIAVLEGKIPPDESVTVQLDSYHLYQLKHILIEMRRHQYYLKDSHCPTLFFPGVDHPKTQFVDWTSDCYYWMPFAVWQKRVAAALTSAVSRDLSNYETRESPSGLEVKWVVCRHTFDWEDPLHVRALINNYDALYDYLYEKLDTYGRTLIFDFERYRAMANLTPVRDYLLDLKLAHTPYPTISQSLQQKFGIVYNDNHLSTILSREIPEAIAATAKKHRLILDTPTEEKKKCYTCGRLLPRDPLFYTKNRSRRDGLSSNCKDCERQRRIVKGGQSLYDKRSKDTAMHQV